MKKRKEKRKEKSNTFRDIGMIHKKSKTYEEKERNVKKEK
jgi:hypothetical protein